MSSVDWGTSPSNITVPSFSCSVIRTTSPAGTPTIGRICEATAEAHFAALPRARWVEREASLSRPGLMPPAS